MANRQKKRNEIDDQYKWDLTTIYKDDEQFLKMLEKIDKEITSLQPKDIFKSGESLYNYLKNSDYLEMNLDKLYTYAHLNNDSDTTVAKYDEYVNKVRNIYQKYAQKTNFFEPQLLKINSKTIEKFYLECPELKEYEIYLKEIYRFKEHTLNEQEEAIIKELSKALNSSSDTYEKLTDTDMTFGNIKDEKNKTVELTESNYAIYTHSKNRRVRRSAFKKLMNKYGEFIHTISSTYSGYVNTLNGISNVYKYSNPLEQSLFADDIDVEVYDTLIKTVHENMNVIYKYYNLRNKVLNFKKSHLYDTYVELIDNDSANYSFSEAKEIVLKALSILGDDYTKILEKAFDEKWLDIYNNKGKRGGAYSSGSFLTNPFILMNFEGKLNDVSTLAHELGHSMHSYFSIKNNSYKNSNYQIFVAEIASTVNEMLLANYLLKESDEKTKILVLNNLLDLFKATIYRQTMFAEFEKKMVLDSKNGIILTSDYLCDNYYKLVKEYFGDNVIIDKEIQNEWARIPHFYYDFYVYKYATGLSIASYIATEIFKGNQEMLKNYREFLKIGGRMNPRESLMTLGIDITKKDVVLNAIKLFDSYIEKFNTYISK